MEKKKTSPILLVAAICLVILAVISLIGGLAYPQSAMMAFSSLSRPGINSQQFTPPTGQEGTFNNNFPRMGGDGTIPGAPGMGSGGTFSGTPEAGRQGQFIPNGQNGTNPYRQFGTNSRSVFSWLLPIGMGIFVLLAVFSAIFLVRKKKWAGILALVIGFLTLIINSLAIYSQVGFARFMRMGSQGSLAFTIIETILALALIVLLLLPKSRALWAVNTPKIEPINDQDDDEDDDDEDSDKFIHPLRVDESPKGVAKAQTHTLYSKPTPIHTSSPKQTLDGSAQKEDDDDEDED